MLTDNDIPIRSVSGHAPARELSLPL